MNPIKAQITALTHDARGVAHIDGKTTFIEGALPGEEVLFTYTKKRGKFDEGKVIEILQASTERVEPRCPHFGNCGGCAMQHLSHEGQLQLKQKTLLDQLKHFGGVEPESILESITGPVWGYRRKARLGAKYVIKKEALLVGFREKNGRYLADLKQCETLDPKVGHKFNELSTLISSLQSYQHIPQIEVAISDDVTALIIRHMVPLSENDIHLIKAFAAQQNFQIYLQPNGPESIHLIAPENADTQLYYALSKYQLKLAFRPTDFIQVNAEINQKMIDCALELLQPNLSDRILDLFCGLGNFTLPLAQHCAEIIGVEGDTDLIAQAGKNATNNNIHNAQFYQADLHADCTQAEWFKQTFNKILLDPPRSGALLMVEQITKFEAEQIVYVSCNPATLARDAGVLKQQGYRLIKTGIMDMFPHTHHVEAISLFTK